MEIYYFNRVFLLNSSLTAFLVLLLNFIQYFLDLGPLETVRFFSLVLYAFYFNIT